MQPSSSVIQGHGRDSWTGGGGSVGILLTQHTLEDDHQINWEERVVIGLEKNFYKRRVKEALYIRKFPRI